MRKLLALSLSLALVSGAFAQQINGGGSAGGGGGGSGTVTSIATACGVSGGPITTTGTIQGAAVTRANTGTTDTILAADCGKVVTESNASAVAVTLPQAIGSFTAPFFYTQVNLGAGTVTITPTTSTINGSATLTLTTGQSADIVSDGTNYIAVLGKGGGSGTVTTTGSPANGNLTKFSGATAVTNGDLSGDCVTSGTLALSCNSANALAYVSNQWYIAGGEMVTAGASNGNANNGTASCYPFYFHGSATISNLGAFVNTLSVGSNYNLAIYANNASTFRPTGTPLGSSGNLSTTTAVAISGATTITIASPRWLWACANSDSVTPLLRAGAFNAMSGFMGSATQANIDNGASKLSGVTTPISFVGGWTDLTSATFTEVQARNWPLVQMKIQ